ncbi:MAG: DUF456 family protein [Phycisphaerales bacterium]|nr:DUF456 family protein [Phycisphaerales bacterium]
MMWAQYLGATLFALFGLACVVVTPLGLPGTWIMIGVAGTVDAVMMGLWPMQHIPFGMNALVIAVLAGIAGEALEFVAGALGAKAGGASRKGAVGSMIGSVIGLIIGTILIPIPLVGSAIGAVAGAVVGAIVGEKIHGREMKDSLKPAAGAAIGRILGALSKAPFALIAWSVLVWDAFT